MPKPPSDDIHLPRRGSGLVARLRALLGIPNRVGALREQVRLVDRLLEEQKTQNLRFDTAINNMSQGLCLFDGKQRLIVCNDARAMSLPDLAGEIIELGSSGALDRCRKLVMEHCSLPHGLRPRHYPQAKRFRSGK